MLDWVNKNGKFIQVLFFASLFLLVWRFNVAIFRRSFSGDIIFLYTLFNFFVVWLNYFILSKIIFHLRNPIRWFLLIISLVLLYFFSLYSLTFPLKFMHLKYPDDTWIKHFHNALNIRSFKDMFLPRGPEWLAGQLYFHLFLFFAGSMAFRYIRSLKEITDLELINADQELNLLKSQIHPHFLFNTLNNLYRLVMDNEKAGEVVLKLSDLLRFTLYDSNADSIPIKAVVMFLEDYIILEKIRHHENFTLDYDFSEIDNGESPIAPLLFINFVENAFKHGVNKSIDDSWVKIKLAKIKNIVTFEVSNSKPRAGAGFNPVGGKGISNVKRRLDILYPGRHELKIVDGEHEYSVNLRIELV